MPHTYPPLSMELQRRLGCDRRFRFRGARPKDGGDYFDTFDGWKTRGRVPRKGVEPLRHRLPGEAARFPFHETVPYSELKTENSPTENSLHAHASTAA